MRRTGIYLAMLTLAFAQLWHVFDMRHPSSRLLSNDIVRNAWVWGALADWYSVPVSLHAAGVFLLVLLILGRNALPMPKPHEGRVET